MSMLPYNIMPQTISPKQSYLNKEEHNEAAIKLITHIAKKKKPIRISLAYIINYIEIILKFELN